jgi:ADP-heptose:LPS heptosyltransferase
VSHLAAAWGAPTLALFGPTDPRQWAPIGPTVTVVRSRDGTMAGLGVEEVVGEAKKIV